MNKFFTVMIRDKKNEMNMSRYILSNIILVFLCTFGLGLPFTSDKLRATLSNGSKLVG